MSTKSVPVTVVMAERCGVCSGDREDIPEHGDEGHEFVLGPRASRPPGTFMKERVEFADARGKQDRLIVHASHPSGAEVEVWAWRHGAATAARQAGFQQKFDVEEWWPVTEAAAVAIGRMMCPHVALAAHANVVRLLNREPSEQDPIPQAAGFHVDQRVWCADCGETFVFGGDLPVGMSPAYPTVSVDRCTLFAPLRPASADERWGQNRPGFGVRIR